METAGEHMGLLFLLVGSGWALIGVAHFVITSHKGLSENGMVFSFIFNTVPFVLPGLMLAGVGSLLRSRHPSRHAVPVPDQHSSVSSRFMRKQLAKLDRDFFSQKIGLIEYRQRRKTLTRE
jgi:hypothetical protein